MAQVGSIVLLRQAGYQGRIGYFLSANNVKWRKKVVPGDTLFISNQRDLRDAMLSVMRFTRCDHDTALKQVLGMAALVDHYHDFDPDRIIHLR